MSAEKMREEFEVAFTEMMVKRHGEGYRSSAAYMLSEKDDSGDYRSGISFFALWAWQASRAAIEVELPPSPYMPDSDPGSMSGYEVGEAQGRCDMWASCREAIESLGLKVKP